MGHRHRRTTSQLSQAASVCSTTPMLNNQAPTPSRLDTTGLGGDSGKLSLSVNYLPSKFSLLQSHGIHKRKNAKGLANIPKTGGGREAFKSGEARMPAENDEDYDGVSGDWLGSKTKAAPRLRWNRFKWVMVVTNSLFSIYALLSLVFCLLTWFNIWAHADVVRVGNRTELIVSTLASVIGIVTSLVGWSGILLNNRSFLALYAFLLWITLAFIAAPGYMTYKRKTFNLEGKINAQWSRALGVDGRLRIQNQLECCGYFSPFIEATVSQTCYARSMLPGCKSGYLKFERVVLARWYKVAFSIVPVHIIVTVAALLCSNHVTYRFGKGMTPKAYRLSMHSMAVIMENYANQLAEQYGVDITPDILAKSGSSTQLDFMPPMPYTATNSTINSQATYRSGGGANSDESVKKL